MKGIFRNNLDIDIIISGEEIARGSTCLEREFPVIQGEAVDEGGVVIGEVKLQKTATIPAPDVQGDREVYFVTTGWGEVYVQLGFSAYHELKTCGGITRRIPFTGSQIWIYNPDSH